MDLFQFSRKEDWEPYFVGMNGKIYRKLTDNERLKYKDFYGFVLVDGKEYKIIWPQYDNINSNSISLNYPISYISEYILSKCTSNNNPIDIYCLQNTLYYIQRRFLNMMGAQFFNDSFEAWECGPVVSDVYYKYAIYEGNKISLESQLNYYFPYMNVIDEIIDYNQKNYDTTTAFIKLPGHAWDLTFQNGLGNHRIIPVKLIKEKG